MSDSDSMTKRIMERICDRRASFATKMILRAAVRTAIDAVCSDGMNDEIEAERLLDDALECVTTTRPEHGK